MGLREGKTFVNQESKQMNSEARKEPEQGLTALD
jgi:hypothetical protein